MLQQFVRGYFPETVMSPDGTEALAVGRVQGTMGSRHKNDSADRTPPGLSAVRTTTYNFDEKTSMDTGIRSQTKVKSSLGDEPH